MLVCDLCLLNLVILVISGLFGVLGTLGQILLSYPVHMHSRLWSLRRGQVHVGPITWEVLPHYSKCMHVFDILALGMGYPGSRLNIINRVSIPIWCIFFSEAYVERTSRLSVLGLEQFGMGDRLGSFLGCT
jgi:hypothetical protein